MGHSPFLVFDLLHLSLSHISFSFACWSFCPRLQRRRGIFWNAGQDEDDQPALSGLHLTGLCSICTRPEWSELGGNPEGVLECCWPGEEGVPSYAALLLQMWPARRPQLLNLQACSISRIPYCSQPCGYRGSMVPLRLHSEV